MQMGSGAKKSRCPACGSETARGEMSIAWGRGAVLFWRSDAKIPREHPFKLFNIGFLQRTAVRVDLMATAFSLTRGDPQEHVPARYCPNCKKVFAWFDAPGVPPEVCGGEPENPEGGIS